MACKDYKGRGGELGRDLMGCCRETEVDARAGGRALFTWGDSVYDLRMKVERHRADFL